MPVKKFKRKASNNKPNQNQGHKRRRRFENRKEDCIYFENGTVIESLPGASFKVKVPQVQAYENKNSNSNNSPQLDNQSNTNSSLVDKEKKVVNQIIIVAQLKAKLIKRRIMVVKGDQVVIEVNPLDMFYNEDGKTLKGTIIERK